MSESGSWSALMTGVATLGGLLSLRWLTRREPGQDIDGESTPQILATITTDNSAFLDQALAMAHQIHQEEVMSGATIETKAGVLMSALGIMASLIVAIGGLLFVSDRPFSGTRALPELLAVCLLVSIGFLFAAFRYGFRALAVRSVAYPSPRTFLAIQHTHGDPTVELKRRQLAELLVSHRRNQHTNNQKAGNLATAYGWGLLSAATLLLTGVMVAGHTVWTAVNGSAPGC